MIGVMVDGAHGWDQNSQNSLFYECSIKHEHNILNSKLNSNLTSQMKLSLITTENEENIKLFSFNRNLFS